LDEPYTKLPLRTRSPATLRPVFAVFRHLPGPVWRRLPLS